MKKIVSIVIAAALLISLVSLNSQEFTFVGKWMGKEKSGTVVYMDFDEDGYVTMRRNDEVMGGKEFKIKGEKFSMTYDVDTEKQPAQLDVTFIRLATGAQRKMFGIYKIINRDKAIICLTEKVRPENFDGPEAITFVRE